MKKFLLASIALLLVGASCANPFMKDKDIDNYPTDTNSGPVTTAPGSEQVNKSDSLPPALLLSNVAAQGDQVVKIEFSVPEDIATGATGYRIMMSKNANPTVENSTDWYDLGPTYRSKLWTVNGTGQRYVKICALKEDSCTAFSTVVPVEVK